MRWECQCIECSFVDPPQTWSEWPRSTFGTTAPVATSARPAGSWSWIRRRAGASAPGGPSGTWCCVQQGPRIPGRWRQPAGSAACGSAGRSPDANGSARGRSSAGRALATREFWSVAASPRDDAIRRHWTGSSPAAGRGWRSPVQGVVEAVRFVVVRSRRLVPRPDGGCDVDDDAADEPDSRRGGSRDCGGCVGPGGGGLCRWHRPRRRRRRCRIGGWTWPAASRCQDLQSAADAASLVGLARLGARPLRCTPADDRCRRLLLLHAPSPGRR